MSGQAVCAWGGNVLLRPVHKVEMLLPGPRAACQPQGMAVAAEPALTPEETARRVKAAVLHVGAAACGHETAFAYAGRRLGLGRWAVYFGTRAGLLGKRGAVVRCT